MRCSILVLLAVLGVIATGAMAQEQRPAPRESVHRDAARGELNLLWHDAAHLRFEGRGWFEPDRPFTRLPARAEGQVSASVWRLSHDTAGMAVPFRTDSRTVHVRWSGGPAMPHMPATGVSGVDLYERTRSGWKFVANGRPLDGETTRTLVSREEGEAREYLLFLPLYRRVDFLEIGVEAGATFEQTYPVPLKPIVFYGTSIVQGGCASRPGMAHPAILRRWFDREVINLGFSGSAKMEPIMAELLAEIDASVYVLDALPNMTDELVEENFKPFIRQLRAARPDVPFLLVGHLKPAMVANRNATHSRLIAELRAEGITGLYELPGEQLLRDREEGTVDGIHPTDLGYYWMAEAHEGPLRRILSAHGE